MGVNIEKKWKINVEERESRERFGWLDLKLGWSFGQAGFKIKNEKINLCFYILIFLYFCEGVTL